jgi:hypothetical protein
MVKAKLKGKCKNPWIVHLAKVRKENPKVKDVVKLSKIAKASYKKK